MTEWQWRPFAELSGTDLYALLGARQEVFILEQTCFYVDMDGLDLDAHHLLGWRTIGGKRQLAAYLRVLAPGVKYPEMSIGRVLTTPAARGTGIGKELLEQGIWHASELYPNQPIRIGAQRYLEKFYASFGFKTVSEPYDEDGIVHVEMLL
jgi:ElaA protein